MRRLCRRSAAKTSLDLVIYRGGERDPVGYAQLGEHLPQAITRAQARDKVKRHVVLLCELPKGQTGRPSKSLSFEEAQAVLAAA
jgi:hypothetical protein